MNRSIIVASALFFACLPAQAARWGGGGGRGAGGGAARGFSGGAVRGGAPAARGMTFTHNSTFSRGIVSRQRTEVVPNHYYFHNDGGVRYWHSYRGGLHWYGFYFGPSFFWFPFYSGYWWWDDVNLARWLYWWDGYWWWNGPGGVPYVYADGQYVPYAQYQQQQVPASSTESNEPQPPSAPPSAPPSQGAAAAPASEGSTWKSPDGKRMVQIVGTDGGAYLFDESASPPVFMKYLGANAEKARFTGGTGGQPLRILVDFKNGSFGLFDADGNPAAKSAAPVAAPAAPPTAAP